MAFCNTCLLLDAGNLRQLVDADFEILIRGNEVAHGAGLERFVGGHIKETGAGESEEDDAALACFFIFLASSMAVRMA